VRPPRCGVGGSGHVQGIALVLRCFDVRVEAEPREGERCPRPERRAHRRSPSTGTGCEPARERRHRRADGPPRRARSVSVAREIPDERQRYFGPCADGARLATAADDDERPSTVRRALAGAGQPLDAATRARFEPGLATTSQRTCPSRRRRADSARAVDALAYAVAENVVFGAASTPRHAAGRPPPRPRAHPRRATAKERDHQSPAQLIIGPSDSPLEREADRAADALVRGDSVPVAGGAASPMVQRACPKAPTGIASGDKRSCPEAATRR